MSLLMHRMLSVDNLSWNIAILYFSLNFFILKKTFLLSI